MLDKSQWRLFQRTYVICRMKLLILWTISVLKLANALSSVNSSVQAGTVSILRRDQNAEHRPTSDQPSGFPGRHATSINFPRSTSTDSSERSGRDGVQRQNHLLRRHYSPHSLHDGGQNRRERPSLVRRGGGITDPNPGSGRGDGQPRERRRPGPSRPPGFPPPGFSFPPREPQYSEEQQPQRLQSQSMHFTSIQHPINPHTLEEQHQNRRLCKFLLQVWSYAGALEKLISFL